VSCEHRCSGAVKSKWIHEYVQFIIAVAQYLAPIGFCRIRCNQPLNLTLAELLWIKQHPSQSDGARGVGAHRVSATAAESLVEQANTMLDEVAKFNVGGVYNHNIRLKAVG
jgi:hypothetical protein